MKHTSETSAGPLSITDLPFLLIDLFEREHHSLLPGVRGPLGLFVRYLRRKPQRGLAINYAVDEIASTRHSHTPGRTVSLTIDETALEGAHLRFSEEEVQQARVDMQSSGVLYVPALGMFVQKFPADGHLATLAASCDTTPGSPLCLALEATVQRQLQDASWQLLVVQAIPIRYKPASRCVIRYELQLTHAVQAEQRAVKLFGKIYSDVEAAQHSQNLQRQLYQEQKRQSIAPMLPEPLGVIEELGLALNEAVEAPQDGSGEGRWGVLRTGLQALQPTFEMGAGGAIRQVIVPEEELRLTARVLARLHNSALRPDEEHPRTAAKEAKRARERATVIAQHSPEQSNEVLSLAGQLAERLAEGPAPIYTAVHGGFKSSQLLFHSHSVFVVDFDGLCFADPALDVGYFLAYLRPSGLWYKRAGMRQWFEKAKALFLNEYQQAMLEYGQASTTVAKSIERSKLYEAALIFKIAARRANRLNSPRPQELAAMLNEITLCLGAYNVRREEC